MPHEDQPPSLVAFDCAPAWIQADAPAAGTSPSASPPARQQPPHFTMVAYTGGAMRLAGWRYPVVVDLAGLQLPSQTRPIRLGHDAALGVGHTERIAVENGALVASGVVSRDTAAAREVVASSRNGFPWQASIGASADEHEFVHEGSAVTVNGRSFDGPINVVRRSVLGEISFVDLGADHTTSASVAATQIAPLASGDPPMSTSAAHATPTEVTTAAVGVGSAPAGAATPALAATMVAFAPVQGSAAASEAATAPPRPAAVTIQAGASAPIAADDAILRLRAATVAEVERIAAVRALSAGHPTIEANAIRDGWDAARTELEVLRASRPQAPAVHVRTDALTASVLEAACLMAGGHPELAQVCDERALTAADRHFRGRMGLQELILEAAAANGYAARSFSRDSRAILRAAWGGGEIRAEGLSTISLPGILSNVANKFLLAGFASAESVWRNVCRVSPVNDFKQITRYRLVGNMTYERVAPGGEIKHGTLGEERFTNQADTYAKMVAIDRRDLINDDLGAITAVPQELGRGAAQSLNDIFWTEFLDIAAFFVAGNKNLLVGADSSLSIDGLTRAEALFNEQVDSAGRPLGIAPAIILVPTTLTAIGSALVKATEIRNTTANTTYPVFNPHQGKYRVEMSRYLNNPLVPGGSPKAWYLLADPADLPVIEVVFLYGQETPTIENATADFDTLGIQLRGFHDFGTRKQDARAAVKSAGE